MKFQVSFSRISRSDGTSAVQITVTEKRSGIKFLRFTMTPEAFGNAVTGAEEQEGEGKVSGLEHVGKRKIVETRTIQCPFRYSDRDELVAWLEEHAQEEGWIVDSYLGSQDSVQINHDGCVLRYRVVKFVEEA